MKPIFVLLILFLSVFGFTAAAESVTPLMRGSFAISADDEEGANEDRRAEEKRENDAESDEEEDEKE